MKRTKEFILKVYDEYLAGATQDFLDKKYKTQTGYHFKNYNLKCRKTHESISNFRNLKGGRLTLNYLFESINNEQEAYIVGLFMADGWVATNTIGFRFKNDDVELLHNIKNYICKDIKIYIDNNKLSKGIRICSIKAIENLNNLGIPISNKSSEQLKIPNMPNDLIRHFIRGYFDGDGTVFIANKNTNIKNKYLKVNICSPTENILKEMQNYLKNNNIESTINCEKRKDKTLIIPKGTCIGSMDMYRLYIRKKLEIKKFYELLYKDSNTYLKRKYHVFKDNEKLLIKLK